MWYVPPRLYYLLLIYLPSHHLFYLIITNISFPTPFLPFLTYPTSFSSIIPPLAYPTVPHLYPSFRSHILYSSHLFHLPLTYLTFSLNYPTSHSPHSYTVSFTSPTSSSPILSSPHLCCLPPHLSHLINTQSSRDRYYLPLTPLLPSHHSPIPPSRHLSYFSLTYPTSTSIQASPYLSNLLPHLPYFPLPSIQHHSHLSNLHIINLIFHLSYPIIPLPILIHSHLSYPSPILPLWTG